MKIRFPTVLALFGCEIRMLLRDRRTIITAIVLPLVVMPLVLFGSRWTQQKRERTLAESTFQYAVEGSRSAWLRALIQQTRERLANESRTNSHAPFRLEEIAVTNAVQALDQHKIQFVLESVEAGSAPVATARTPETPENISMPSRVRPGAAPPAVRILYRGDRDDSNAAMGRIHELLLDARRFHRADLLADRGFTISLDAIGTLNERNIASKGETAGLALGKVLTLFVLIFIFSGGAVVANDLIAGEKERGTLETLLTTGAGRTEIVIAKHLVILGVAVFVTLVQAANLFVYVGLKLVPAAANLTAAITPGLTALILFLLLPVAALAAGVLLLVSGYARTYKEAQLYFPPVVIAGLVPALAAMLPGLPLRSAIAIVPIANLSVAVRDALIGSRDWWMISVSWITTAAFAAWTTRLAVRFLSTERLITASENDSADVAGGVALLGKQVWRWYALMWAVLWVVSGYLGNADLRVQITANLALVLFGGSLLMIKRYRLDWRTALAWRAPKPAVWLAVLWAVPSGLVTAGAVTRLADLFVPVSSEMMEEFTRSLLPEGLSLGQLLFFMAVMPGFFEELAFRGVLLHALRERLHPVLLALVVGTVFGLFHFALFRLLPTAFLGALFAAVTMLTGSIFPAMLWHAGNNALGIIAGREQLPLSELDPGVYGLALGMLGLAFWVFWRNRTPCPGLRRLRSRGAERGDLV